LWFWPSLGTEAVRNFTASESVPDFYANLFFHCDKKLDSWQPASEVCNWSNRLVLYYSCFCIFHSLLSLFSMNTVNIALIPIVTYLSFYIHNFSTYCSLFWLIVKVQLYVYVLTLTFIAALWISLLPSNIIKITCSNYIISQ